MRRAFLYVAERTARVRRRLDATSGACGMDGVATLLLSNLVILASGGLIWLWLLMRVHRVARRAPSRVEGVGHLLVLGMRLQAGAVSRDYALRLGRAVELLRLNAGATAVVLGGRTDPDGPSEAAAGRDYLLAQGVAPTRVVLEDRSRHTLENLREARRLLPAGEAGMPVLVTSRFHLARSAAIAEGLGLRCRLCAAETRADLDVLAVLRLMKEAYHLHWYYVGRTWARLTGNVKMLDRIS